MEIDALEIFEKSLSFDLTDPYYYIDKNALSKETCKGIIDLFERSPHLKGRIGKGIVNTEIKKTFEFLIEGNVWKEYDAILCESLYRALDNYSIQVINKCNNNTLVDKKLTFTGYQIQKYIKYDGYYIWHTDFVINNEKSARKITFLWYLNDIEEGGETYFYNGKVKPETGKLLLFPSTWTYNHKGNMPKSDDKYIITGWVSY
jgi:hypothetical protein